MKRKNELNNLEIYYKNECKEFSDNHGNILCLCMKTLKVATIRKKASGKVIFTGDDPVDIDSISSNVIYDIHGLKGYLHYNPVLKQYTFRDMCNYEEFGLTFNKCLFGKLFKMNAPIAGMVLTPKNIQRFHKCK